MCHSTSHHFSGNKETAITRDLWLRSHFCHTLQNYVSLITRWQFITLKWDGTLLYAYLYATEKGSNFSELYKCPDTIWTTICQFAPVVDFLHIATSHFPWGKK